VMSERFWQIETKAVRKLNHPNMARKLRCFLDNSTSGGKQPPDLCFKFKPQLCGFILGQGAAHLREHQLVITQRIFIPRHLAGTTDFSKDFEQFGAHPHGTGMHDSVCPCNFKVQFRLAKSEKVMLGHGGYISYLAHAGEGAVALLISYGGSDSVVMLYINPVIPNAKRSAAK
jgi:hypothetical protein